MMPLSQPLISQRSLGKPNGSQYAKQAKQLRKNIDKYFAHGVEGFDTYAYYKGNGVLRSWICIPLTVGIDERAKGTIDALFSPRLWTENGLLTQAGDKTFWDRSTLYALRGVFAVGATEKAMEYLKKYSNTRLLGDHVPYAIEAWYLRVDSGISLPKADSTDESSRKGCLEYAPPDSTASPYPPTAKGLGFHES